MNRFNTTLLFVLLIALLAACGPTAPTPTADESKTAVSTPDAANPFLEKEAENENADEQVKEPAAEPTAVETTAVEATAAQPTAIPEREMVVETAEEPAADEPVPSDGPTPVTVRLDDAAIRIGDPDAPVTIIEYTDYQCPFCQRHVLQTMPAITSELIDTGRVQYVIKDFPLDSLHADARIAAAAARCAADQDSYLPMHDVIFTKQSTWSGATPDGAIAIMTRFAEEIGLDTAVFTDCLQSGKYDDIVQQNLEEGAGFGVTGTPAFFINGYPVTGAQPFELFDYAVDLAEKGELASAYTQQEEQPPQQERPQPPTEPVDIPIDSSYAIGDPNAPVVIIEYTDFQCPFCVRHQQQTFPQIDANFIQTGQVYYVYKDFPLSSIHPQAVKASEAARCAGDQEAYSEMHDFLFSNQQSWSGHGNVEDIFTEYAGNLGLDTAVFNQCLTSGQHEVAVMSNVEEGYNLGVGGTPAFFINGNFLSGAQPYSVFEQAILSMLE